MSLIIDQSLPKKQHLCTQEDISLVLEKGKWLNLESLKCCYLDTKKSNVNRIMISIPKRLFKRAVKRNLLRRRIREAYRLQKILLNKQEGLDMIFVYKSPKVEDYLSLFTQITKILELINSKNI